MESTIWLVALFLKGSLITVLFSFEVLVEMAILCHVFMQCERIFVIFVKRTKNAAIFWMGLVIFHHS
jgi:hypothetical protein